MQTRTAFDRDLDEFVEAYEAAVAERGSGDLNDFLPPATHPHFYVIAAELMRVDLEHQWSVGNRLGAIDYQRRWPDVLKDASCLEALTAEEERQRRQTSKQWEADETAFVTSDETRANDHDENGSRSSARSVDWSKVSHLPDEKLYRIRESLRELPHIGESFLGFDLREELGRGSFGRVFLAEQTDLARRFVVLKITACETVEPDRLARLQHTNIVPIYSVHTCGLLRAIVMPFLGRRTLAQAITELSGLSGSRLADMELVSTLTGGNCKTLPSPTPSGQTVAASKDSRIDDQSDTMTRRTKSKVASDGRLLFEQAVVALMGQITNGLMHAHERGIVHRDLKPANILLADDGQPLLLDFNLAADVSGQSPSIEYVGGTLPYMAPEQLETLRGEVRTDERADIYSLGVIFFELLTGKRPFPDHDGIPEGFLAAMIADRRRGAIPVRQLAPDVSVDVESIVGKCLDPQPSGRYQTARALYEDLQRQLDNRPLRHAPNRSLSERCRKWSRRHPRITSTATIATLVAGFALAVGLVASRKFEELRRIEARDVLHQFEQRLPDTQVALLAPNLDSRLATTTQAARQALDQYRVLDLSNWLNQPRVQRLSESDRRRLRAEVSQLLLLLSSAELMASRAATEASSDVHLAEAFRFAKLAENCYGATSVPRAILVQQAEILQLQGRSAEAGHALEQAASSISRTTADKELDAFLAMKNGRYHEAVPLLEDALSIEPTRLALWFSLGNCRAALKQFGDAERCFSIALAINPNSYRAYFHRGLVRLEMAKFDLAKSDFDKVLEIQPNLTAALFNRALARRGSGDLVEAEKDLSRALATGDADTRIYFLRAQLRRVLGNAEGAAADMAAGLSHEPSDEASFVARGLALVDTHPDKAVLDFQSAIRLDPASQAAHFNLAYVQAERLGQLDAAIATLNRLIEISPEDSLAISSRGVLLARAGRSQEALADAAEASRISHDPQTSYRVACIYALTPNSDGSHMNAALESVRQALAADRQLASSMAGDPDLQSLSADGRYQSLISAALSLERKIPSSILPAQKSP